MVRGLQTRSDVGVAGVPSYWSAVHTVSNEQLRSVVGVSWAVMKLTVGTQTVATAQRRFVLAVGATIWYSVGKQVCVVLQRRSVVDVGTTIFQKKKKRRGA